MNQLLTNEFITIKIQVMFVGWFVGSLVHYYKILESYWLTEGPIFIVYAYAILSDGCTRMDSFFHEFRCWPFIVIKA